MAVTSTIIPCRFLSLMAHLVMTTMLFWSREPNILACVSPDIGVGTAEYNAKDIQLIVALSLSVACILVELFGLITGLSMFTSLTSIFSIAVHISASITLSVYVTDTWSCDLYWFVFCFCCFIPFLIEIAVISYTLKFQVFN